MSEKDAVLNVIMMYFAISKVSSENEKWLLNELLKDAMCELREYEVEVK